MFEILVIPSDIEDLDPSKLDFSWVATEMTENTVNFELNFNSAMYVSYQVEPDTLKVIFRDRYMFVSENSLAII